MSSPDQPLYEITESTRQHYIDRISHAYARDLLTEHEFEQRLEDANSAGDLRQLRRLVHDLPEQTNESSPSGSGVQYGRSVPSAQPQGNFQIAQYAPDEQDTVLCLFSGVERKGGTPARRIRSITVFGGTEFDFRRSQLESGGVYTIDCAAVFGGVDVIVPKGINVEVRGMGIFGGFDGTNHRAEAQAPTIRIRGLAVFGGVDVKVKE